MTSEIDAGGDTIFALSSAPGRAGVAVVRASGPQAGAALAATIGGESPPPPRQASYRVITDPESGDSIDRGLVLWFPAPASVTGESVAEWHIHGGRAVVAALHSALSALPGMRHAEPGEFSRRAFLNGRMDLTAAEGLADLIASETEAQRRQALRQMEGSLGSRYEGWRTSLIGALAHIEAALDFTDQDLPEGLAASARDTARGVAAEIKSHLDDSHNGERLRDGVQVAVVGPPNAGKSSLVNSLARRDVAIVSDIPGTTRDVIEIHLDLAGVPVTVADTAGLRNADDSIEKEGVRRARLQAVNADLVVAIFDAAATDASDALQWPDIPEDAIFVANKIDLTDDGPGGLSSDRLVFGVSCLTGMGLDKLLGEVTARSAELIGEGAGPTRARHRAALTACVDAIDRVKAVDEPELIAEDLRIAAQALGRLTGRVDVEDILDVIFAEFCIGK